MREPMSGKRGATCLGIIAGLIGVLFWVSGVDAKSSSTKSSSAPPTTVAKASTCDYQSHPKIATVTPNRAKPGPERSRLGRRGVMDEGMGQVLVLRHEARVRGRFVVRPEHWFRAVENDRDPERRAGEHDRAHVADAADIFPAPVFERLTAMVDGRPDLGVMASGQVVGLIDDLPSCQELITRP